MRGLKFDKANHLLTYNSMNKGNNKMESKRRRCYGKLNNKRIKLY